ncbi:MAG TPA: 5'-nucleotidase C-terminal domain-containing protein, partial [Kouleothrix sp.]|nr:5'-nucleotidase C-terminal domain-containing protein [Kouleothrix sp.]
MLFRRMLPALIGCALLLPSLLLAPTAGAKDEATTITILQTSDLHTNLLPWDYYTGKVADWGLARVATLIKQERAKDPNLLLLDSGDTIQGTPLGYYYARIDQKAVHPMALTMNALRYDAAAIGNHEFNYGLDTLNRWKGQLNFPLLSANIRKSDGSEAFQPYVIKEVNGVKVGILGLTTPAIPNWEKPENIAGLRFDSPVDTARQYVPQIRAAGADVVVISQHIGWDKTPANTRDPQAWLADPSSWVPSGSLPDENLTIELAQQVPGIDVILAGHSHLDVPKALINNVLIVEPSYWGRALAKVTLQLQRSGSGWQVAGKDSALQYVKGVDADQQLTDLAYPYHDQTLKYISTPIGTATGEFPGGPAARYTDGPLADLINTVQSDAAAAAGYPVDISLAAIFNDTGHIPQGQIALRDAYSSYIYDNTLYVLQINGDILRRALEKDAEYFKTADAANLPADPKGLVSPQVPDYNWDIYTGIDYTIDLTKPVGQRVTKLQFKGKDVAPDQAFRIAINNYRASGGGGFAMFKEGTRVWQSTNEIRDLIAAYVQAHQPLDPAAINTRNFTLVPDLYARYYASGQPQQPSRLPNTGGAALPAGLVLAAGAAL